MKKFWAIVIIFLITLAPVLAKNVVKTKAILQNQLKAEHTVGDKNSFIVDEDINISGAVSIPAHSTVEAEIIRVQKELRWHKSGYAICKLLSYKEQDSKTPVDISDKDVYLIARQYKYVDKKEVTIITTEILGWSAVSFFAPGVDIGYFFLKGAIMRNEHPHWFKSGVSNAYNNSILWFILKGKEIGLNEGDEIQLKHLTQKELKKRIKKIDKRKLKTDKKLAKKEAKQIKKEAKALVKAEKEQAKQAKMKPEKLEKYLAKKEREQEREQFKDELIELRNKIWKKKWDEIDNRRTEELKYFANKKKEKKEFKNNIKKEKAELKSTLKTLKGKEKRIAKNEGKQNIKNEKTEFKNNLKQQKQVMKLAKKELKKETKIIKKEAKAWYKENKQLNKKEAEQIKKEPVKYSYDTDSLNEKIYNRTISQKMQVLSL